MKKFDCVKMMRDIRNKMVKKYLKNPKLEMQELRAVREKYGIVETKKKVRPHVR